VLWRGHYCTVGTKVSKSLIFTRVGTYVQRGSKFCFVVLVVVLVVTDTLIRILHYCPISPCFQHIIAYSLARQPCARLPGSLARACPAALRALARQPCTRLPGSLARAAVQTSPNRFSRICARFCPDKSKQVQQNITPYCTMLL
jgi:hypothetical protein